MCGIIGALSLNKTAINPNVTTAMLEKIKHRGPDGQELVFLEENQVCLGHARLSILDLSHLGTQPMFSNNKRYCITYNGEVYNFLEIKSELINVGFKFISECDTEVVLAAFEYWGMQCFNKFNGMWAIAIWDNENKELTICRDRFGVKPFYYAFTPNKHFLFASETVAFKNLTGFYRSLNLNNLGLLEHDIYALEGRGLTIYNEVFSLLPGHFAKINLQTKEIIQKRWFDINEHIKPNNLSLEENANTLLNLLEDSTKLRLISDVPVATALSGGLDSSTVYSLVNKIIKQGNGTRINADSQKAFIASFPGLESDETEFAQSMVNYINGKAHFFSHEQVNINEFEEETKLYDTITNMPLYSISSIYKNMRLNGYKVSLDGHGVDEMLYGYRDMVYNGFNHAIKTSNIVEAQRFSKVLTNMYFPQHQAKIEMQVKNQLQAISSIKGKVKRVVKNSIRSIIKPTQIERENYHWPNASLQLGNPYNFENLDLNNRMVYNEFFQRTLPTLLRNFDFAAMANGVEIRMPFMDFRVVSFLYGLPNNQKINNGLTKLILRHAMQNLLPNNIRLRTYKVGIGSPWEHWKNNELKTWNQDMLHSKAVKESSEILKNSNDWMKINLALIS